MAKKSSDLLRSAVMTVVGIYFAYAGYQVIFLGNLLGTVCGTLVIICSLAPTWVWLNDKVKGFPIMPLFSGTFSYTYGLQFLTNHDVLAAASASELIYACALLCLFLLLACAVWKSLMPAKPVFPTYARMMGAGHRSIRLLLILFACFTIYNVASAAGWIFLGSLDSAARLAVFGFGPLSTFALSYLMGQGKLSASAKWTYIIMFVIAVMASASSLILITSYSLWFLSLAGFALGSRRMPWRAVLLLLPLVAMLQYGKYAMRADLWKTEEERFAFRLQPSEYAAFYARWMELSLSQDSLPDYLRDGLPDSLQELKEKSPSELRHSLLTRSSLLQQFLLINQRSPKYVPFMNGQTYAGVLSAIMPRFFFPNKISSLESTNLISIHYGLQSREDTTSTTIGWGVFNEAFANYGFAGIVGLAIVIGLFIGWVNRYTLGYPLLSAKGLFAIIIMSNAIQSEYTSATFAACMFQAVITLLALSAVAMETARVPKEQPKFNFSFKKPSSRRPSAPPIRHRRGAAPAN